MPTSFEHQHPLNQSGFFRSDAMAQHGASPRLPSKGQDKTDPPGRVVKDDPAPSGRPRSPR
jgi:hypothetical protein